MLEPSSFLDFFVGTPNKGDYSWLLQSEERRQEASGYCEIVRSVFSVLAN